MLGSVVLVLGVASVLDLTKGDVDWFRIATHAPLVAGLVLSAALARNNRTGDGPAGAPPSVPPPTRIPALNARRSSMPRRLSGSGERTPPAAHREIA